MVTRAQLDRLGSRIEALAQRHPSSIAVILVEPGEAEAEAKERHYRLHPADRQAAHTLMVVFVSPKKGHAAEWVPSNGG